MLLKEYLKKVIITDLNTRNQMRLEFIKRLNEIIYAVGSSLTKNKELSYDAVLNYIEGAYVLSKQASRKYADMLIKRNIFIYTKEGNFRLPEDVVTEEIQNVQQK